MKQTDWEQFYAVWSAAQEVTGGNSTDAAIAMAFKILERYEIKTIQQAVMNHLADVERGRFSPKPADIISQIQDMQSNDGRPDADEAWAIAIESMDEYKTVVLNNEIAKALEFATGIYHDGDKVGARLAFRSSYDKAVKEARDKGLKVNWFPSLGFDKHDRKAVLERAVEIGRLPRHQVARLLPEPITQKGQALLDSTIKKMKSNLVIK